MQNRGPQHHCTRAVRQLSSFLCERRSREQLAHMRMWSGISATLDSLLNGDRAEPLHDF